MGKSRHVAFRSILGAALGLAMASATFAQDETALAEMPAIEALPPHLAVRVAGNEAALAAPAETDAEHAVIEDLSLWNTALGPIRVCFMDGDISLKKRIAAAARGWEIAGSSLRFDFGSPANPRYCDGAAIYHVRIGFRYAGYWSLVGQHSLTSARQNEQSMNFDSWDVSDVDDATLRRVVLHEFGHAIGLHHEHQSPRSVCEQEFDWEYAYKTLREKPNRWPKEVVDRNLRQIWSGLTATAFDPQSIMIYALPASYYLKREESPCFHRENDQISSMDQAMIIEKYPADTDAQATLRQSNFADYQALVSAKNILSATEKTKLLNAVTRFTPNMAISTKALTQGN